MNTERQTQTRNSGFKAVFEVADPVKELAELAHIMLNLRQYTRRYDTHFGYDNRNNKRRWEEKADQWIARHQVRETNLGNDKKD